MPVTVSVPCAPPGTDTAASAVTSTPLWYSLPFSTFNSVPPMLTVASAPCSSILNEPSVAASKGCVADVSCCEPMPGMLPSSVVTTLEPPKGASLNSGRSGTITSSTTVSSSSTPLLP